MIPDLQRNAIISVYDKNGIDAFAEGLVGLGWRVYSSGGTARFLRERGIPVIDTAEYIGAAMMSQIKRIADACKHELPADVLQAIHDAFGKPMMNHRIATLWPQIHGGILYRGNVDSDIAELNAMCAVRFELVRVDMYPLPKEIKREGATYDSVIENIDIGGPTLLRSAGKAGRITICDSADHQLVLDALRHTGDVEFAVRRALHAKTEHVVSEYCAWSAYYLGKGKYPEPAAAA